MTVKLGRIRFQRKNGKSEEQLCEELGDIDEFITELAQMEGIDLNARRTGPASVTAAFWTGSFNIPTK